MPNGISLSVQDRVAIVTGGSRGIGAAGVKVMFNYQKSRSAADAVVEECGQERCAAVEADLRNIQSAHTLIQQAVQHFGGVDILVANHGIWPPEDVPVDRMGDRQWHDTIAINLD